MVTGIPNDIMRTAANIVTDICVKRGQMVGFRNLENEYLEQAIATAILAERERCAAIAEGNAKQFDFQKALGNCDDAGHGHFSARLQVAADIRKGGAL